MGIQRGGFRRPRVVPQRPERHRHHGAGSAAGPEPWRRCRPACGPLQRMQAPRNRQRWRRSVRSCNVNKVATPVSCQVSEGFAGAGNSQRGPSHRA